MDDKTLEDALERAQRMKEISDEVSAALDDTDASLSEALDVFTYFIGMTVSELCETDEEIAELVEAVQDRVLISATIHRRVEECEEASLH